MTIFPKKEKSERNKVRSDVVEMRRTTRIALQSALLGDRTLCVQYPPSHQKAENHATGIFFLPLFAHFEFDSLFS